MSSDFAQYETLTNKVLKRKLGNVVQVSFGFIVSYTVPEATNTCFKMSLAMGARIEMAVDKYWRSKHGYIVLGNFHFIIPVYIIIFIPII